VTASANSLAANATTLTINGFFGFNTTAASYTVTFNGTAAGKVTGATATTLTVTGLTGLVAGNLTAIVAVGGLSTGAAVEVATVTPVVTASVAREASNFTSLVIHGIGFSTTVANNTVAFTSSSGVVTTGIVTSATATTLTVTGLSGLTGGALIATVTSNAQSSAGTQVATVIPVVTSSGASQGLTTTTMIINGFGFSPTASGDAVTFGGGETGTVTSATANQLSVHITSALKLGPLTATVTVDGQVSVALVQVAIVTANPVVVTTNASNPIAATATTLTILGSGFSAIAANDTVTFGSGVTGTVSHATTTQLTITNLTGLVAGNLSALVTASGVISRVEEVATVTPVVTARAISIAAAATSVVIQGFGFSSTAANNTVTFNNGTTGIVTSATATTLTVTDLSGLTQGSLTAIVISNGVSSGDDMEVANVA
jgi:hypothetical protein